METETTYKTYPLPAKGEELGSTGYTLLEARKGREGATVVLAVAWTLDGTRYATWIHYEHSDLNWGHYFQNVFDAVADYKLRVQEYCRGGIAGL